MKASSLSTEEIIRNLELGHPIDAEASDGGFRIKVSKYVPFVCTAIHDGNRLRADLRQKIALTEYERWYEEDPNTADFITSMPITVTGLDSRFEYDLNRSPEECIYEEAWGKKVWKRKLSSQEIRVSMEKHANYFRVIHALISKIESLYEGCIVYDIHSFNHQRWEREVPLFNIGTELVNRDRFRAYIGHWIEELGKIILPDIPVRVEENDVFPGKGYHLMYISRQFPGTLVLATEIKKVYCNELTGDLYPKVLSTLQKRLKTAILNNANYFSSSLDRWHYAIASKLLDKHLDSDLIRIDKALFTLLNGFELLAVVNPVNIKTEKKKFIQQHFSELPKFQYRPVKVNPFQLKQQLLAIPVQQIQDISLRSMYQAVVNSYFDKIDLIGTLNTNKFHYNSLRYFGRPSKKDLANALYIMHLPDLPGEAKRGPTCEAPEAVELYKEALSDYGIEGKVELSNRVISQVMTLHSRRKILIQPEARFIKKELHALLEHEVGIHLLTTVNSGHQPLKIFDLGLPVNTETQEGMAVLAEYLSGNMTLRRLKKIALRVILVDMMCYGADFIECFRALVNDYDLEESDAYDRVTRVFRGGGFTKDYLYLSGFVKIYKLWMDQYDLLPLLVGKTSLNYLGTIEEMIGREMIGPPAHIPHSYKEPRAGDNDPIYKYIFSGLQ
jgi:uncharacterized protein (TIGR02421 family)